MRDDESCRVQWAALLGHMAFLLDGVPASHPDRDLAERAVAAALPVGLAAVPDLSRGDTGAYGAALRAMPPSAATIFLASKQEFPNALPP